MSVINTGALASALRPGINEWYGAMYNRYPAEWSRIFDTYMSTMNYEIDVNMHGFGMGVVKQESESVTYDVMQQGFKKTYIHTVYGLGFVITEEMIEDNLYMKMAQQQTEQLALSMAQVKETVAANVLNRAFNSSYTMADGLELCSTAHLLSRGGTWSNKITTAADLSEASLEQALIDIAGYTDDAGNKMQCRGIKLIVAPQNMFDACRLLKSEYRPDTANNDVNTLNYTGMLPQGYDVNHYLTDADAWFIKTDAPNGFKHFKRRDLRIDNDTEFNSNNMRFKALERYSFGVTDPRCVYGSPGV